MPKPRLTTSMTRMLLQLADGVELDALATANADWIFTLRALSRENLIKFVPHEPGGNAGTMALTEAGEGEVSRIHAANAQKATPVPSSRPPCA